MHIVRNKSAQIPPVIDMKCCLKELIQPITC